MTEDFLSFIWKHTYFITTQLYTTKGEPLKVHSPGTLNTNAGPDFDNAKIGIDSILWRGKVELHIKSSYWDKHGHQKDKSFNTVVLHVVWEHDKEVRREDGSIMPTLELKNFADKALQNKYLKLMSENQFIPCESNFIEVKRITKLTFLDRLLVERLERKGKLVLEKLNKNNGDWRETTFKQLSGVYGIKVNQQAFEDLASRVGYKILQKHKDQLFQIEALLYGQGGFLNEVSIGDYSKSLKNEYQFLSHKYDLKSPMDKSEWKYSRLRPSSFPTSRISKLAALLATHSDLFMSVLDVKSSSEVRHWLNLDVSGYWKKHYDFDKQTKKNINASELLFQNFIINGIGPLKVAYGLHKGQNKYIHEAIALLESLKSEKNNITANWKKIGLNMMNACDSQGAIELYNEYCLAKKCLNCAIGVEVLSKEK